MSYSAYKINFGNIFAKKNERILQKKRQCSREKYIQNLITNIISFERLDLGPVVQNYRRR